MVDRVRKNIAAQVPAGETVLVVSGGDDEVTALEGRVGWHFPRSAEGWHAGGHPADDDEAIAHLEKLRQAGARWIAFPTTSLWWLDHYAGFHRHLARTYAAVSSTDGSCVLFSLHGEAEPPPDPAFPLGAFHRIGKPALVSVVIPCYKQAHFLADAIGSVREQTYPAVEIVVVDDGSPDTTRAVVEGFPEVNYIRQENKGLSAARNRGLSEAQGAYLVFLDADDRLLPRAIAAGLQTMYSRGPDCAFVSGHYRWIGPHGDVLTVYEPDRVDGNHYEALLRLNYIGHPGSVIYRRWIFGEVGAFDEGLPACEDYDLYLRIARLFSVCRHYDLVAEYRRHDQNMSGDPALMLSTVVAVLESQRQFAESDPVLLEALEAGLSRYRRIYGRDLMRAVAHSVRRPHT